MVTSEQFELYKELYELKHWEVDLSSEQGRSKLAKFICAQRKALRDALLGKPSEIYQKYKRGDRVDWFDFIRALSRILCKKDMGLKLVYQNI